MQQILICTQNKGKFIEISQVLSEYGLKSIALSSVGIDFDVEEIGETYEENATLKAETYGRTAKIIALADDAGIEVAAINGAPGVNSRRFFKSDMEERNRELLDLIKDKEDRRAKFVAVVAVYDPKTNLTKTFRGEEEGVLVESTGTARVDLGYDSIFLIPELNKTYAHLSLEEKNQRSHRALATRQAATYLKTLL